MAGNWKMNLNSLEGADFAQDLVDQIGLQTDISVCICPPFTALESVSKVINASNIQLGAQNMHFESGGAYTGEISAEMLRHLFTNFVILGHSERREYFGETDAIINKKVLAALNSNLRPILCVGETLEERENGRVFDVLKTQIQGGLKNARAESAEALVIAYEPVWAIGTGKTATPEMAEEVHAEIRCMLARLFNEDIAEKIHILYGGSMKPENADALLAQKNIDGGLIGGASIKVASFVTLVKSARRHSKQADSPAS